MPNETALKLIWKQNTSPVVLRRGGKGEKLRIRLPYRPDNKQWLLNGRQDHYLEWVPHPQKYWEAPKSWFNDFVERALKRFGGLYIIQPFREQEICAHACMNAKRHECQCSCMGANHGMGNDGNWFEVSESFAMRWHNRQLACRFLKFISDGAEGL